MLGDVEKGLFQLINAEFPAKVSGRSPLRLSARIAGIVFTQVFSSPVMILSVTPSARRSSKVIPADWYASKSTKVDIRRNAFVVLLQH